MQYKKYDCETYNIYTIKTDKFKSCMLNVVFRDNINNDKIIPSLSFFNYMLTLNNNTYKNRRDLVIREEELYNATFYVSTHRLGESFEMDLGTSFINPYYVTEEDYLDEIIKFTFDMIKNPKAENEEFDVNNFNIAKERILLNIDRIHESGPKFAIKRALQNMDAESITAKYLTKDDIEKITPSNLYKTYQNILKHTYCDIYVVGDLDMDEVASKIKKEVNIKEIKNHELNLYVQNKNRKKALVTKEKDGFVQSNMVVGYNIDDLDSNEKIAFRFFAEIFGGGMNSKLYQNLREKNSLCYGVRPIYYKYDNLCLIHVSFDEKNYDLAVKLIKKSMKEMEDGNITDEEFERAKKSLQFSFKLSKDNINSILDNYIFHNLNEVPLVEDYEEKIKYITKDDVIKLSKKLHLNFIYLLGSEGGK